MKVLIDTDVLLDVALNRKPFVDSSAAVLRWAEAGGQAAIAWHSISNCAYLLENDGRDFLKNLLSIVSVTETGKKDAVRAIELPMHDLEDAMQVVSARSWGAELIITRNGEDFKRSPVKAMNPFEFLELI